MTRRFFAGLAIWLASSTMATAMANSAAEQFRLFAATFPAASGSFQQQTVGAQGPAQRMQNGEFYFQRPGRFRWEVKKPYAQLVVSDGKTLFQHDPDLRQTTVRPVGKSIGSSPAAILFGDVKLDDAFKIEPLPDDDGMVWLRAIPKQPDSGLNQVDIGMKEGKPARLLLRDSFGQTTRIDLSGIRAQSSFPAKTFEFTSPPGTDTVRVQ